MQVEANSEGVVPTTNFMQIDNMVEGAPGEPIGWMYMMLLAQCSQTHWRQVRSAQASNGKVAPGWSVKLNLEVDEALDSKVSGNH